MRNIPLSALGSPTNASSHIKVCPTCWDPPHPQSFLPLVVAEHGADPQALRDPRPDIFPVAFPIAFKPASIASTTSTTESETFGGVEFGEGGFGGPSSIRVNAYGVFGQYDPISITTDDVNLVAEFVALPSPVRMLLLFTSNPGVRIGVHLITFTDALGNKVTGVINIV
jgi:hypothetical protein